MKHGRFFKNAAVVSLGGLLAKAVGAFYRIPLANALGGYGEGLYHMAYPLFCLMLTFSSAGVPALIARRVAAERAAGRDADLVPALRLFAGLGACAALFLCLLALPAARLQGEAGLTGCYLALAPAVFFVALLAVLRGAWQGRGDMMPTACSELCEQLVKAGAGLLLAARFPDDPVRAAQAALFAVTLSEAAALILLAARGWERRRTLSVRRRGAEGALFYSALPVMAGAALVPLSQMLDSVLVVRLLARHTARAVRCYGLFAGSALSLVSLPASLCCGLAAAAVPAVAACAERDGAEARRRSMIALGAALALSVPCAAVILCFAPFAVRLLLPALAREDAALLIRLLRILAVSAVTRAAVETLTACLTAMGMAKRAALSMLAAVVVKTALEGILVADPAFGVAGAAVASNVCYLVAFFFDLFYTVTAHRHKREKRYAHHHRTRNQEGTTDAGRACGDREGGRRVRAHCRASFGGKFEGSGDRL